MKKNLLKNWMDYAGIINIDLAKLLKCSSPNISCLLRAKRPQENTEIMLAKAFGVSLEEYRKGPPTNEFHFGNNIPGFGTIRDINLTDTIPLLTTIKCAEGINWIDSYPVGEGFDRIPRYGVEGDHVFAVQVDGDSMESDLKDKDILIIDGDKAFINYKGGIGVIKRDEKILIRKVYKRGDMLLLEPSNKVYEADMMPYTGTIIFKPVKIVREMK